MKTVVKSAEKEVQIGDHLPFVIIGEKINPTGSKKLAAALSEGRSDFVCDLARQQVEAGADILDVNVGVPGLDEERILPEIAKLISETVAVPLCLDSANVNALSAALAVLPGRPLVNSVNGDENNLSRLLPVVKQFGIPVIGLTMDEDGVPETPEQRLAIAGRILERAAALGIPAEDVIIDPLVMTAGSNSQAGVVALRTIELVRQTFGVNVVIGASNISFGLPDRHTINLAFLALAIGSGATCAITDPALMAPTIRATDLLVGRDNYARRYISYWRAHKPKAQ